MQKYLSVLHLKTGWSNLPEDKATKYRLTIKDIQQQESGTYTCASPRGLTNSIVIIVTSNLYLELILCAGNNNAPIFVFMVHRALFLSFTKRASTAVTSASQCESSDYIGFTVNSKLCVRSSISMPCNPDAVFFVHYFERKLISSKIPNDF